MSQGFSESESRASALLALNDASQNAEESGEKLPSRNVAHDDGLMPTLDSAIETLSGQPQTNRDMVD